MDWCNKMSLKDLSLKLSYNSGEDNIVKEFYLPCFANAHRYDRAVGFFTSEILVALSCGLEAFIAQNGQIRLICNPRLREEDVTAIEKGYKERDDVIYSALLEEINKIPSGILNDSMNFLSWLIKNNKLDIRIAFPEKVTRDTYGIYHEKIGVFYDEDGNVVAFSGSNNETLYGVSYNYESFDVYESWVDAERCKVKIDHFESLWNDYSPGVKTYDFPKALKDKLIEKLPPQEARFVTRRGCSPVAITPRITPSDFMDTLWYFQKEAIDSWFTNNFQGIFSMATGTGKTKTAIGGVIKLMRQNKNLLTVICCPQNTILKQWQKDIDELDIFKYSIVADGTNQKKFQEFADKIIELNEGYINNCVVYTTYNTFSTDKFIKIVSKVKKPSLLICDEVHWSGAETFGQGLIPAYQYRLGLSATPNRYMDEEGSDDIKSYFGKVVYEFTLERALKEINPATKQTFLTPYAYFPKFVALDPQELESYHELCRQIKQQFMKEHDKAKLSDKFQRLCEKRQAVITNAVSKYTMLRKLIKDIGDIKYLLLYCSPQQIDNVQDMLNENGIVQHRFTGEEGTSPREEYNNKSERDHILSRFEEGDYKALVAMKCLDEGINILRAELAILLANTGNPKEYIQRRGRLLRRHPNKQIVRIYDLIVVPTLQDKIGNSIDADEKKILKKELKRYEEFSSLAENKIEAMNEVFRIKELLDVY